MLDLKITDAHVHFWKFDPVRDAWITGDMQVIRKDFLPADAEKMFFEWGVEGCVAVQADTSELETSFLLDLASKHTCIHGVVGWVDLKADNLEEKLQAYKNLPKLKGFREIMQGQPDEAFLGNRKFREGIAQLGPHGFTYDILIYHDQLPSAIRFAEKYPEQQFMLDHIAKPDIAGGEWKKWKENMRALAQHPGMLCKLSGMVTEAHWKTWSYDQLRPYMEIAAEYFGTGRLCFGSDWPVSLLAADYGKVLEVVLEFLKQVSPEEQRAVLSGNTRGFYKLDYGSVA